MKSLKQVILSAWMVSVLGLVAIQPSIAQVPATDPKQAEKIDFYGPAYQYFTPVGKTVIKDYWGMPFKPMRLSPEVEQEIGRYAGLSPEKFAYAMSVNRYIEITFNYIIISKDDWNTRAVVKSRYIINNGPKYNGYFKTEITFTVYEPESNLTPYSEVRFFTLPAYLIEWCSSNCAPTPTPTPVVQTPTPSVPGIETPTPSKQDVPSEKKGEVPSNSVTIIPPETKTKTETETLPKAPPCVPKTPSEMEKIINDDPTLKKLMDELAKAEKENRERQAAIEAERKAFESLDVQLQQSITHMKKTGQCPPEWGKNTLKQLGNQMYKNNEHLNFDPNDFAPGKNARYCGGHDFVAEGGGGTLVYENGKMTSTSPRQTRTFGEVNNSRVFEPLTSTDGVPSYRGFALQDSRNMEMNAAGDHVYFKLMNGVYLNVTGRTAADSFQKGTSKYKPGFYGGYIVITEDFNKELPKPDPTIPEAIRVKIDQQKHKIIQDNKCPEEKNLPASEVKKKKGKN